jgi:hypothetical protein
MQEVRHFMKSGYRCQGGVLFGPGGAYYQAMVNDEYAEGDKK